ncbi:hypothetical protein [Bacillus sonorensis]|nr:hypothetical protein [Bacillus sonorensis]
MLRIDLSVLQFKEESAPSGYFLACVGSMNTDKSKVNGGGQPAIHLP